ncbi:MAG: flagellar basal body rod protein FlgB [Dehalococcoidia bacterium]|nr:flagellar basal body rod protein FlgB [Dehalococcoidia bacterium]
MGLIALGDSTIGTAASWLRGLSQRQQAISDNIANIDTPGYVAQEVPFETALQRQLGRFGTALATTDARHINAGMGSTGQLGMQRAQMLTSARLDGSTVDIDAQMIQLAETQMRYQAASSALNTKLGIIRNVIRG